MADVKTQTQKKSSPQPKTFAQYLLDERVLDSTQLNEIRLEQTKGKESFEQILLRRNILDEEKLTQAKAGFFHLPYIDLRGQDLDKDAVIAVPKDTIATYQFVPFSKMGNIIKVALTNPSDFQALQALEFLAQDRDLHIELYLISNSSFLEAVRKTRTIGSEVGEALQVIKTEGLAETSKKTEKEKKKDSSVKIVSDDPITRIVNVIIQHAIQGRSSDIHIEPQENDLRIRYRIDGVLQSSLVVPKAVHPAIVSRIKILSNLKIDEQRLPQDGRFHMDVEQHSVDFRVSTLPTVNGEKVVMRILDKSGGVPTLEELGMSGLKLDRLRENINKAHGMLLVTGPTGSGKSTTLYSSLNILNEVGVNIVTLEDPVEYYVPGVNQSQVNPDIGLTFASGLRSILRQDPDIIMVGEIRDQETAELAVHSALTGHLVFSTLHTNDAIGAIPRMVDMGIEEFLIIASVNVVMAQRLVRKICQECKVEETVTDVVKDMIKDELQNIPKGEAVGFDLNKIKLYKGKGCRACGNSGYGGRVGIYEVMPLSPKIKALIINHGTVSQIEELARTEGMINMMQDGYIKSLKGFTTIEEIIRATKV